MSRRSGQNPSVRVGKRADGEKYYFFQYWSDIPGQAERRRETEIIGPVKQMTRSEAERKKLEFISNLKVGLQRLPDSLVGNLRTRGQTLSGSVRTKKYSEIPRFQWRTAA